MNCAGSVSPSNRSGTSDSFENCAILPSTGKYWFDTSSGGATMRKQNCTGLSSIALKSTPLAFRFDGGAPGLWWGLTAGLAAAAVLQLARVRAKLGAAVERVVV